MSKDKSVLMEAEELIHGARQKTYGHPYEFFSLLAKLWSGLFGVQISPELAVLGMMIVKIARLRISPEHRDSLVDVAGYAGADELVLQKKKELEENK